jgi:beta-galactosidase GanA
MSSNPSTTRIHIGASYYPEHWPEGRWADDIQLMKEAGFTVARMADAGTLSREFLF